MLLKVLLDFNFKYHSCRRRFIFAKENDPSCPERRHSTVDRAAKAPGLRLNGKLRRCASVARQRPRHRIVRARSPEAGESPAGIARNAKILACRASVPVAAGGRPLIGEAAASPFAGNAQIPACTAGDPAVGRRHASARRRGVTELHLWVAWRPLIGEAAANPAAGIAQIPRGT